MGMTWRSGVGVALVAALLACSMASGAAAEGPAPGEPAAEPRLPGTGPLARLGRGAANVLLSPLEVPATMVRVGNEHNAFYGLWAGALEGLGNGLVRLSAGVLEVLTFPLRSDGLPLYHKRLGERALPPGRPPLNVTMP
ncbi:MAG: exosortase system-associated protein, TIGR04073 family [Planctomycetes bacterium]|nr:exosortase system-associated protein, TIGR04073 family [Planctomycetota bacterium]